MKKVVALSLSISMLITPLVAEANTNRRPRKACGFLTRIITLGLCRTIPDSRKPNRLIKVNDPLKCADKGGRYLRPSKDGGYLCVVKK